MKNTAIKFVASVVNFEPKKFKGKPVTMSSSILYGNIIDRINRNQDLLTDVDRYKTDGRLLNVYGQAVIDSFLLGDKVPYSNVLAVEKIVKAYKVLDEVKISDVETRLKTIKDKSLECENGKPNEYHFFVEGYGDMLSSAGDIIKYFCRLQVTGEVQPTILYKKFTIVNYNTGIRVKVDFSSPATVTADLIGLATFIQMIDAS